MEYALTIQLGQNIAGIPLAHTENDDCDLYNRYSKYARENASSSLSATMRRDARTHLRY